MALEEGTKAQLTYRYWVASLAWKNIGDWAKGWTAGSFIHELKILCNDNGRVGGSADQLLDDMIHDRERNPLGIPGLIVPLRSDTNIVGQYIKSQPQQQEQG